ncbi:MAG: hypothetical protein JEZ11_15710 [Desulfobacterales bacterium]|nr:hypothetical protein [Desulfobacterales bacterium]
MPEKKRIAAHGNKTKPSTEPAPPTSGIDMEDMIKHAVGRRMIHEASLSVREHISRQPHVQRLFSFMPTLMTRVSPFHFRNKNTFKDWPLVRLDSGETETWGSMRVVGELLVIFDETVLFCLLALMGIYRNDAFETDEEELCRLAAIEPSQGNRNAIWNSIQRLTGTRIDLDLTTGKGKRKKPVKQMTGSILSFSDRDRKTSRIRAVVNPYFLEMYGESFVTNIDLTFRAGLKSDIAKACYRFFQGQIDSEIEIGLVRLARAINLDTDRSDAVTTRSLRSGLQDLADRGYLDRFHITPENRVQVTKTPHAAIRSDNMIWWRSP